MGFTPQELAEMAAADAEIEASFRLTQDDLQASYALDRFARRENLPGEKRVVSEHRRAYYVANKEKIVEYQRAYYAANKEKIAEYQREHRAAKKLKNRLEACEDGNRESGVSGKPRAAERAVPEQGYA